MSSITFNPMLTTNSQNSFILESQGYIQGMSLDNQPSRMQRKQGQLLSTSAKPVYGGMMVNELTPDIGTGENPVVQLATAQGASFAFTVFDGVYNAIILNGNTVPLVYPGMSCQYFRNGNFARIPVLCAPALAATLENSFDQTVFWDFTNQQLLGTGTTALPCRIVALDSNSLTVSFNATTGAYSWVLGTVAVIEF